MADFATELTDHYRYACGIAWRRIHDRETVQDIAQTSALKAWQARNTDVESFRHWYSRIVVNTCIDERRKIERKPVVYELDTVINHGTDDSIRSVEAKLLIEELATVVPPSQWRVIMLHVSGYSYEEIAGMLGVSVGAAKSYAYRGREVMREYVRGMGWTQARV